MMRYWRDFSKFLKFRNTMIMKVWFLVLTKKSH
jgi:hypothetical protein